MVMHLSADRKQSLAAADTGSESLTWARSAFRRFAAIQVSGSVGSSVPNAEVAIFSPYDSKAAVAAVGTN